MSVAWLVLEMCWLDGSAGLEGLWLEGWLAGKGFGVLVVCCWKVFVHLSCSCFVFVVFSDCLSWFLFLLLFCSSHFSCTRLLLSIVFASLAPFHLASLAFLSWSLFFSLAPFYFSSLSSFRLRNAKGWLEGDLARGRFSAQTRKHPDLNRFLILPQKRYRLTRHPLMRQKSQTP